MKVGLNGRRICMRQIHNELISSQQTPRAYLHHDYKYKRGMHSHMFVEDFCRSFSIKLAPIEQHDEFYDVSPADDLLKKLLTFDDYSFFRYSFDKLLDTLMYHLILNGTAYLEIVKWVDSKGTLQGIELVPICVSKGIKAKKVYRFFTKTPDRQSRIMFKVNNQSVVSFYLKDLGFKKTYFRQLLNKFSRFDTLGTTNLALDKSLEGIYNFTEHQKQLEFQFLNCTRKIFWNGRNYSNQHLSESYLLYRAAYADMLQYRFLDYMLQKLNNGFEPLRQEFGFVGRIITPLPRINYSQHLAEYHDGKINASQLGDVILKKNLRN